MDKIIEINSAVNGFVWGPIMLALLVGTGIYLSFRVGFIQFSKIGYWWKNTIGKIFTKSAITLRSMYLFWILPER